MCGITGYFNVRKPDYRLTNITKGLLLANQSRGSQSTGIALIDNEVVKITKKATSALHFVNEEEIGTAKIMLGHTRLATTGSVEDKNAHPFENGNITGVHNGMINNWAKIDSGVNVDSEVIFKLLNEMKAPKALKRLNGSFAIAWHDKRTPNTAYLVSNGNPLSLAYVNELHSYVWSSEILSLVSCLSSCGYSYKAYELDDDTIYTITDKGINKKKINLNSTVMKYEEEMTEWNQFNEDILDTALNEGCVMCNRQIDDDFFYDDYGFTYCLKCGKKDKSKFLTKFKYEDFGGWEDKYPDDYKSYQYGTDY